MMSKSIQKKKVHRDFHTGLDARQCVLWLGRDSQENKEPNHNACKPRKICVCFRKTTRPGLEYRTTRHVLSARVRRYMYPFVPCVPPWGHSTIYSTWELLVYIQGDFKNGRNRAVHGDVLFCFPFASPSPSYGLYSPQKETHEDDRGLRLYTMALSQDG